MGLVFCVDAGGTKTRGALFDEHRSELARAFAGGGALSLGVAQSAAQIRAVWQMLMRSSGVRAPETGFVTLMAGVAGCGLPGRGEALVAELSEFADVRVVPDGYGALMAAQRAGFAGVVTIGTGIAALRLCDEQNVRMLGGWGFPAGDRGSGAWIGLQLMGALLDTLDGAAVGPPFPADLAALLLARTGSEVTQIQAWHMGAKPADFADLVPLVVERARAGDAFCGQLLEAAARHVTALAAALISSGGEGQEPVPGPAAASRIALCGGLAPTLAPRCRAAAPALDWATPHLDPLLGLLDLALAGHALNAVPRSGLLHLTQQNGQKPDARQALVQHANGKEQ